MINLNALDNPILSRSYNLRDPSIYKMDDEYFLYYSRLSNIDWSKIENWSIACIKTKDFKNFYDDIDISPKGFASPGDLIYWNGKYILPYQSYPQSPVMLCYSESTDLLNWSRPKYFLKDALNLIWNTKKRVIDPTFVVKGDTLFCYFVGSTEKNMFNDTNINSHSNLLGLAKTKDLNLQEWEIISVDKPLIGWTENAPDGVENASVFKGANNEWLMIISEGLRSQHLALAVSKDLVNWQFKGQINIEIQDWNCKKHGAPFVWKENDNYFMVLMGEDKNSKTTLGLLTSCDGYKWNMIKGAKL